MSILLQSLLNLQQLDDRLSETQRKKKDIPVRLSALEEKFEAEKNAFETQQEQLKQAAKRQRQLEKDLQEGQEHLKKQQSRLLEAKTNDEYRALVKEIEFTQNAHSEIETEILMIFDEIDDLKKDLKDKEKAVKEKEKQFLKDKQLLEKEVIDAEEEQKKIAFERKRVSEGIPLDALNNYEKIRQRRGGQAVVVVEKDICSGCNMFIPPQRVIEVLQTGEIRYCPSCQRIIYCELQED